MSALISRAIKSAKEWKREEHVSNIPLAITAVNTECFSSESTEELGCLLSCDEIKRYANYKHTLARSNFAVARIILRAFASHILRIEPNLVPISIEKRGKPYIQHKIFKFNISHSNNIVVIAIDKSREIGVDIEEIKIFPEWECLAVDLFNNADWINIKSLPKDQQLLEFYRKWTFYESMGKAAGSGLSILNRRNSIPPSLEMIKNKYNITECPIQSINGYAGCCSIVNQQK